MPKLTWTEDDIDRVAKSWNEGMSGRDIARSDLVPGKSRSAIIAKINKLRREGDERIKRERLNTYPFTDEQSLYLLRNFDAGLPIIIIAKRMHRDVIMLRKHHEDILRELRESEAAYA